MLFEVGAVRVVALEALAGGGARLDEATSARSARLHWIDWLRVAAIAGVFVYHSLRPFDATGWHVKNAATNDLLGASQVFFATFGLAVLFLLSGAGAQLALRRRSCGRFLRERTLRLLVPFVLGTVLLSPIQAGIEAAHRGTAESVLPDFGAWWSGAIDSILDGGISPTVFGLGYHLWFLGFLFAFSVIGLPLFVLLRTQRGRGATAWLAGRFAARPGTTLGMASAIAVLLLASATLGTDEHDWSEFGLYFAYFLIGFVLLADERFLMAVRRDLWLAVAVVVGSTVALVVLDFGEWFTHSESRGLDPRSLAIALLFVLEGWGSTLVVLNIGLRMARLQRPVSPRMGEVVLPLYVVHQPVILAVAFVVVQWPLGILPKWVVVFAASLAVTLALVELGLRGRVTRLLLGARPRASTPLARVGEPAVMASSPALRPNVGAHHAGPR